jgi:hypothetical protein
MAPIVQNCGPEDDAQDQTGGINKVRKGQGGAHGGFSGGRKYLKSLYYLHLISEVLYLSTANLVK